MTKRPICVYGRRIGKAIVARNSVYYLAMTPLASQLPEHHWMYIQLIYMFDNKYKILNTVEK